MHAISLHWDLKINYKYKSYVADKVVLCASLSVENGDTDGSQLF